MRLALGRLVTTRNLLLGTVLVGVALRVVGFLVGRVSSDAASYAVMADGFLRHGEFLLPLGEYWSADWSPAYSHHYSPAYPLFLVPFVALGGLTPVAIKLASLASGLGMIAAAWWTTRDLYGPGKALFVAAAVSVDPVLVLTGAIGYSENLLTLFFVLTMWAILKSLRDGRYIVLAGLFAGLAYLTKGVVGWFFLIAGLAGLAWRFHFMGWRVFRDRHYLVAIAIFGGFVGAWAARNLARFWDGSALGLLTAWQSSAYFALATERAAAQPADVALVLLARIPLYAAFFLLIGALWLRELRRVPKASEEHYSGLWLAVGLTYLLAWLLSGILWALERNPIYWIDQARYVVMANVVIVWLFVKDGRVGERRFRRKFGAMLGALLAVSVLLLAQPSPGVFAAYDLLQAEASPGDTVAIDGLLRYEVFVNAGPDLSYVKYVPGVDADFILTRDLSRTYPGYALVGVGRTSNSVVGLYPAFDAALWRRA